MDHLPRTTSRIIKKFFTENSFESENHLQSHFEKQEKSNYLTLEVESKSPDRTIELARKNFELFECIAKFWDMVTRYLKGKTTEIENGVVNAVRWVGIANSNDSDVTRYVQYIFALEALLAKPKEEIITPSIAYRLAEWAAFIIGETAKTTGMDKKDFRKKIFHDVKNFYSSRSKIAHGNDHKINKADLNKARNLIYNLIISVMDSEEILKFKRTKELSLWIENLKFEP